MNLNKCQLAGRLARDPDLTFTPKGNGLCKATIAVNRRWKDDSGEVKEEVSFIDLVIWGKTGEPFAKYLKKGSEVYIDGRLNVESWEDKETKKKRSKVVVVVESWQFTGARQEGPATPMQAPAEAAHRATKPAKVADPYGPTPEDDVPF